MSQNDTKDTFERTTQKKDDKQKEDAVDQKKKSKSISEMNIDKEVNPEKHLRIILDQFNPSKDKDFHSQLYKD